MTERYEPTIAPTAKKQLAEQLPESVALLPMSSSSAHWSITRSVWASGSGHRCMIAIASSHFDELSADMMSPLLRVPNHPLALARFGAPTVLPASVLA